MSYVIRQKFSLDELVSRPSRPRPSLLLAETDEILAAIYARHLEEAGLQVKRCSVDSVQPVVREHRPDLVIVNLDAMDVGRFPDLASELTRVHPVIRILTLAMGMDPETLKQLMNAGIAGHIDRAYTNPRDIVVVVKSILQY